MGTICQVTICYQGKPKDETNAGRVIADYFDRESLASHSGLYYPIFQVSAKGEMISLNSGMLSGKVALVSGGSGGFGGGIVKRLAREGAAVAFTYAASHDKAQQVAQSIEEEGGRALAIQADSADAAAVRGAIDQTVKTLGRLDVFVNNAGILLRDTIDQVSLEDLDKVLAVNGRSAYVGIQAAARHMAE